MEVLMVNFVRFRRDANQRLARLVYRLRKTFATCSTPIPVVFRCFTSGRPAAYWLASQRAADDQKHPSRLRRIADSVSPAAARAAA